MFANRSYVPPIMRGREDARTDYTTYTYIGNMYEGKRAIIIICGSIFTRLFVHI